jgi:hypothetical protein
MAPVAVDRQLLAKTNSLRAIGESPGERAIIGLPPDIRVSVRARTTIYPFRCMLPEIV